VATTAGVLAEINYGELSTGMGSLDWVVSGGGGHGEAASGPEGDGGLGVDGRREQVEGAALADRREQQGGLQHGEAAAHALAPAAAEGR